MNFNLPFIPEQTSSPHEKGLAIVNAMRLSLHESEEMAVLTGEFTGLVKLGFVTSRRRCE